MQPKTAMHHKVFNLSQSLTPITKEEKQLAIKNVFFKYGTYSRKTIFCLECSHSWKDDNTLNKLINAVGKKKDDTFDCPVCKEKLTLIPKAHTYKYAAYVTKYEANKEFQIIRIFYVSKHMKNGTRSECFTEEVIQHFISETGEVTSLSKTVNGFSLYYDSWITSSKLTIMPNGFHNTNRGRITSEFILPKPKYLQKIKRNGFKGSLYNIRPQHLFPLILNNNKAETLLKLRKYKLLKYMVDRPEMIERYWNSLIICFRNNYEINSVKDWMDYVTLLEYFNRDLLSPKFICPSDLSKEHNRYVTKKREQQRKEDIEKMKLKLKEQQRVYSQQKNMFFGLQFTNDNITVKVLSDVRDFLKEGDILRHCIYTHEYFEKENSLILSARVDNKITETVEVSLTELKVLQSRGFQNKPTKYTRKIRKLVRENIYQIGQIYKQAK